MNLTVPTIHLNGTSKEVAAVTLSEARREGYDTFMFSHPRTAQADRAAFAAQHPGGVEYTEEFHSRGMVFTLYCYALRPRQSAGHKFIRGGEQ